MGCVWFIYRNMELCYWLVPGNVKNNWINQLNEKRPLIPLGLRVLIWKNKWRKMAASRVYKFEQRYFEWIIIKAIIVFSFCRIWRILQISEGVLYWGRTQNFHILLSLIQLTHSPRPAEFFVSYSASFNTCNWEVSLSTRGPSRRGTCHLTDFSQTFTDD